MIALYSFYVGVVVFNSWWERRRKKKRRVEVLICSEYQDDEHASADFLDEPYPDDRKHKLIYFCFELIPKASTSSSRTQLLSAPAPSPIRTRSLSNPGPARLQTDLPRRSHSRTPSPKHSPHFSQGCPI
jgi:sodium/potassium/calcium exchanger 6